MNFSTFESIVCGDFFDIITMVYPRIPNMFISVQNVLVFEFCKVIIIFPTDKLEIHLTAGLQDLLEQSSTISIYSVSRWTPIYFREKKRAK